MKLNRCPDQFSDSEEVSWVLPTKLHNWHGEYTELTLMPLRLCAAFAGTTRGMLRLKYGTQ